MKINKTKLLLLIIIVLSLILRLYSAYHTDVATDEMIYSLIPLNIISAGRLSTVEQSPLYFYLADLGYKIFVELNAVSIRITSIFFGCLAILAIFLLAKEWFKHSGLALWSAFFFAVSGYVLRYTIEMDMVAYSLIAIGIYFLARYWNTEIKKYLYLDFNFLSLSILVKSIALIFLLIAFTAYIISLWKKNSSLELQRPLGLKHHLKTSLKLAALVILIISPVLIYNYLLYQEKGITDYYFSVMAGIGETVHQGLEGKPWALERLKSNLLAKVKQFLTLEGTIFLLGITGLALLWKNDRRTALLSTSLLFIPFIYLAGQTGSASHYLFVPMVFSLMGGYGSIKLNDLLKEKIKIFEIKYIFMGIIIATLFFTAGSLLQVGKLREQSIALALESYSQKAIPDNAVIVIDPRIYYGINAWVFYNKHYLSGTSFPEFIEQISKFNGPTVRAPLFYIECSGETYCGWKPEDYQRIAPFAEELSRALKKKTKKVHEIKAEHHFLVYEGQLTMPFQAYEAIDRSHVFWFYPVGWKYPELAVDYYEVTGGKKLLHNFGLAILWANVIIALLIIPWLFYLVFFKKNKITD